MRRSLSILLMLLFGAGPLSFAFNLSDDLSLPACCRRHGAHHCAMDSHGSQKASRDSTLKARSRCREYPQQPDAKTSSYEAISLPNDVIAHVVGKLKCSDPADTDLANVHLRTPALRGPPANSLS